MEEYNYIKIINTAMLIVGFMSLGFFVFLKRKQKVKISRDRCALAWERVVAFLIDFGLCLLIVWVVSRLLSKVEYSFSSIEFNLYSILFSWLYFSIFESSKLQATPGKMIENIKVVDLNGERISFVKATLRYFSSLLSDIIFFLGNIPILFTKYRQALHDMISNTLVVKKEYGTAEET